MAGAEVDLVLDYISCQSLLYFPEHDGRPRGQGSGMCVADLGPVLTLGMGRYGGY